jgi:hypothetical protein
MSLRVQSRAKKGKMAALCLTGVHGDEDPEGSVERDDLALELELLGVEDDGLLDAQHLLRDHRKHLRKQARNTISHR